MYFLNKIDKKGVGVSYNRQVMSYDGFMSEITPGIYYFLACSKNASTSAGNNACLIYEVNSTTDQINVQTKSQISLGDFCGDKVKLTKNYAVVACSSYN